MLLKETLTKTLGSKEFIDACWRNLARDFLRDLTITKWRTRIEIEDDNSFIETSKPPWSPDLTFVWGRLDLAQVQ